MPPQEDQSSYLFAGYRLEPLRGMLLDPARKEVRLRPKPFALLRYLLDHPGRLLGREELFEALWPGVVVTDDSLTQCMSELRRAFDQQATTILRTVPRRGYLLMAEVQREPQAAPVPAPPRPMDIAGDVPRPAPGPQPGVTPARRDTLLVLPATSPFGDEAVARMALTFASDLITELVQFEDLRVIAGADASITHGFALRIEVHASGETYRAFVRMEDIATGTSVWADRIEWPGAARTPPLATLAALAGAIDLQIGRKSLRHAQEKPQRELSAREMSLIGRDLHQRGTEQDTIAARAMFLRAIETDPGFAAPYAWMAFTLMRVVTFAWSAAKHGGTADATAEAVRLARKAVGLDPESVLCQSALAFALALAGFWEEAVETARLALRFSRVADYGARTACGEVLAAGGHPEEAVAALRETLALDPHCPPRSRAVLGRALLLAGQPEEALRELRRSAARLPDYAPCARTTVVAATETGMIEEARAALEVVRRLRPEWLPGERPIYWFLRRPEDIERFRSAFQVAQRLDAIAATGGLITPGTTPS